MIEIADLLEKIRSNGHDLWINGPTSASAISELEKKLSKKLPESLSNSISQYGAISIYDDFVSGVIDDDALKKIGGNIYADTIELRNDYPACPSNLWVLRSHEDGAYCIDLEAPTINGEYAIVNFEFDSYSTVANSFSEFICQWCLQGWAENPA